jgi:CRISPR-associated endonuclease/helicase Cas3
MPVAAPGRGVHVRMDGYKAAMARAVRAAQKSEAVLWIRSTVTNAIDDWEQFRRQGVPVILHHSRYADEDRAWLDAQVLGIIGLRRQRHGGVIVGTQTLEQSLDIDADLLVTDGCPADVLLQRLGALRQCRPDRKRWPVSSTAARITGTISSVTACRRGSATALSKCPRKSSCLHLQVGR